MEIFDLIIKLIVGIYVVYIALIDKERIRKITDLSVQQLIIILILIAVMYS